MIIKLTNQTYQHVGSDSTHTRQYIDGAENGTTKNGNLPKYSG